MLSVGLPACRFSEVVGSRWSSSGGGEGKEEGGESPPLLPPLLSLNIGGQIFQTSAEVLGRADEGSVLRGLLQFRCGAPPTCSLSINVVFHGCALLA